MPLHLKTLRDHGSHHVAEVFVVDKVAGRKLVNPNIGSSLGGDVELSGIEPFGRVGDPFLIAGVEIPAEVDKEPEGNGAGLDLVTGDAAVALLARGTGLDDGDLERGRRRLGKSYVDVGDVGALVLRETHGRYAIYWNAVHRSSGHAWQGRYYSCPLDQAHLWEALRYAELNPVRAGLVIEAEAWMWSSAAAHCGIGTPDEFLDRELWRSHWTASAWRQYLGVGEAESRLASIRHCTHTGRPLGTAEFVQALEGSMKRRLAPQNGGRPAKMALEAKQSKLAFEAE
jgi:hypothetical protein